MDDFNAFLMGKLINRKTVSGGSTNGRVMTEHETTNYTVDKVPEKTIKYAEPFVEKLRDEVWSRFNQYGVRTDQPESSDIYERYTFSKKLPTRKLPIEDIEHVKEILKNVRENTVVVLRGPTGCGKTTKVPQFILDDCRKRDVYCNIVVAQPRRIAASSNAKRVCKERGWACGTIVGYQVGSDHRENRSDDTRILFCTTGVLVEKIINGKSHNPLDEFTHIILDEVHERDKDMDFLMVAIYKYLNPKIRIIMMSATIDVDKFAKYYQVPGNIQAGRAPVIELGYRRNFSVEKIFLDQLINMNFEERINLPEITEQQYDWAVKLIIFLERMDRKHSAADGIDVKTYESQPKPTILVFLPGIFEIKQMYQRLEEWTRINGETKILRIIMHSTADPLHNELALQESDKNTRKIILATNIAESSITVPDVKYVIDFCLTRNLVVNEVTKFPTLQLAWASRDNCEQRAGRTGRVTNGYCFRFVSRDFYFHQMRQSAKAELVTSPLENIILKTKQLNLGSPEEVLALALDKPYLDEIHNAVLRLKEMGAMLTTTSGKVKPRDGDITYIGEIMSKLPIEVKLSKLIALGYCFGVLDECITIAAALNCSKNMFTLNRGYGGIQSYSKRLEFADGSGSDLFALLNAFKKWKQLRGQGKFGNVNNTKDRKTVQMAEKKWAEKNYLEISCLRECDECIKDLRRRINRMNLIDCTKSNVTWNKNEKYIVLKVVIAGAFYPNYFSRSTKTRRTQVVEAFKKLDGRDPCDTVYFTGFRQADLPHLYIKSIKDILIQNDVISEEDACNTIVSHDGVSEKVYISFKKSGKEADVRDYGVACQPGFVLTEVYKSVKLRSLKKEHPIQILCDRNTALSYANTKGLKYTHDERLCTKDAMEYTNVCYPRKRDKYIKGYISHTENCGRFWFQPTKHAKDIEAIRLELNNPNNDLESFANGPEVFVGQILAAAYPSQTNRDEYFRAKVIFIERNKVTKQTQFKVRFIDFGNTKICRLDQLKRFRGVSSKYLSIPPYCFQCSLAFIQPSQVNMPNGVWTDDSKHIFSSKTDGIEIKIEIYSVINGVVRVYVTVEGVNINKYLMDQSIAEYCDESWMSKQDHIERKRVCNETSPNYLTQEVIRYLQETDIPVIEPPTSNVGRMFTIKLKGPFTPLEISLYGLTNNSSGNPKIEEHSVNQVLLENEPNDISEKYLIAVTAHQHDENSATILRQTTLMPNIRLFGPLMAAIFAPKMALLRNKSQTNYIKMMTGLGVDESGKCLSMQTNMKFDLDAELKNADIETVNGIRLAIDCLMSRECLAQYSKEKVVEIMQDLQEALIRLLATKRFLIADEYGDIKWNAYKREDLNKSQHHNEKGRILQSHQTLRLFNPHLDYLIEMENHNDELHQRRLTVNDDPNSPCPKCKICNVIIDNGIQHHLLSRQHIDRMKAIKDSKSV